MTYETRSPPVELVRWHALDLESLPIGSARFVPRAAVAGTGAYSTRLFTPRAHYYARKAGIVVSVKKQPEGVYITRLA